MASKKISKLIRIGDTSLGIIIPKGYITFHQLKHGDLMEVIADKIVKVKPVKLGGK